MISQLIHRSLAIPPCPISRGLLWPPQRFWRPYYTPIRSFSAARIQCEQKGKDAAVVKSGPTVAELNGSSSKNQKPDVLAQASLSTQEQRKEGWAIMKEMAKYLWPKDNMSIKIRVGVSLTLLVGAKRPSSFLLQKYRRFSECGLYGDWRHCMGGCWVCYYCVWRGTDRSNAVARSSECDFCERSPDGYTTSGMQRL